MDYDLPLESRDYRIENLLVRLEKRKRKMERFRALDLYSREAAMLCGFKSPSSWKDIKLYEDTISKIRIILNIPEGY